MALIDNHEQTLQGALKNALTTADRVDISVGFFYFSGFEAIADQLKDKKVRILVGLEVEPKLVSQIAQSAKDGDVDLERWQSRIPATSNTSLKLNYLDSLVGFINDSDIFDSSSVNDIYDLYIQKIKDGSLEIRKTKLDDHGKLYLVYNKPEFSQNGDLPGTAFVGSSNFTYKGLVGQGELNDVTHEKIKFNDFTKHFEDKWSDAKSISIADAGTKEEFLNYIKPRIWKYSTPLPYHIYLRILHELFYQEDTSSLKTPGSLTNGLYTDLEYQIDAVKMVLDKLRRYDGAILADVVGLGKSIIAAAVARNIDMNTVIVSPPHLIPQWDDYKEQFGVRGSKVFSSGKLQEVYERYHESNTPFLLILDEAHRYRNEDTSDYQLLHQICRSHPENKVLLLTATPFNNDPKDVFALIKLFQTPGQSTIRSVDNLSLRYRELIQRYKKLRKMMIKDHDQAVIDKEAAEIAAEQRRLIEPIIIRRSRLDLNYITRYREDLKRQKIDFAEVRGPELLKYELGPLLDLYLETLDLITMSEGQGFIGARYKPSVYLSDDGRQKFIEKFKDELGEDTDLQTAQSNLAQFMRRLLVTRFESSKDAFRSTLQKMIKSNEVIDHWWSELGTVPILKKGELPDPGDYDLEDGENDAFSEELSQLRDSKRLLEVSIDMLDPKFIDDVRHDTKLLKQIYDKWFLDKSIAEVDPKLDEIDKRITGFLQENPNRKIVIFSMYKDTVDYLYRELIKRGCIRTMKYTAADASDETKKVVKAEFDASLQQNKQSNDYDVLVATDALSEGYNLHRAGIVVNYDIPYNPTRVIQRVGRINRINKKVFDYLYVYNCFPTAIGEEEIRVKLISTLKINLINAVVGSDTRTLTKDEELVSFFKDEFHKAEQQTEQLSWDTKHREVYEQALKDKNVMKEVQNIPRRSRIKRLNSGHTGAVVFGKKGENTVFTKAVSAEDVQTVSAETALPFFEAQEQEKGSPVDAGFNDVFNLAKDKLFAKHELPKIQGRRASAISILKIIGDTLPKAHDYCEDVINIIKTLDDISDGALKDISQLSLKDIEVSYQNLLQIVPETFIRNVQNKAGRTENEQELLLFAEQFI